MENEKGYVNKEKKAGDVDRQYIGSFGNFGLVRWNKNGSFNLTVSKGVVNRREGKYYEQRINISRSDLPDFKRLYDAVIQQS